MIGFIDGQHKQAGAWFIIVQSGELDAKKENT